MSPREAREKRGITMLEFCMEHRFDPGSMSRIERGKQMPSPEVAAVMVKAYKPDVTWEDLFSPAKRAKWIAKLQDKLEAAPEAPPEASPATASESASEA